MWRACGVGQDFSLVGGGADDNEPRRCVVVHRRNVLHCVVRPEHASNAVVDVGNIVGIVLDFPTNVAC